MQPPYVFSSTGEVGSTFAVQTDNGLGVAAIDITLRSVNQILANSKVTPDTRVALINGRGEVLSSHLGAAALIPAADGKGRMPTIDDLELPMLKKLMGESVGVQSGTRSFTDDQGNTWEGGVFRFSMANGELAVWIAAPPQELLASAYASLRRSLYIVIALLLVGILAAYALSGLALILV